MLGELKEKREGRKEGINYQVVRTNIQPVGSDIDIITLFLSSLFSPVYITSSYLNLEV